ncbi:MAG: hypothetical protein JW776_14985 [Candidatus Lokiarchaeota archaeon]|nr:hypothetical protein [Candidatus Lokiarchaeota archaeon]
MENSYHGMKKIDLIQWLLTICLKIPQTLTLGYTLKVVEKGSVYEAQTLIIFKFIEREQKSF